MDISKLRRIRFILDMPRINRDGSVDQPSPGQGAWYFEGQHLGILSPYYVEDAVRTAQDRFGLKSDEIEVVYPDQLLFDLCSWIDGRPPHLPVAPVGRFRFVRPYSELPGILVPIR